MDYNYAIQAPDGAVLLVRNTEMIWLEEDTLMIRMISGEEYELATGVTEVQFNQLMRDVYVQVRRIPGQ